MVRAIGEPKLTLVQKLAAFDPALHLRSVDRIFAYLSKCGRA